MNGLPTETNLSSLILEDGNPIPFFRIEKASSEYLQREVPKRIVEQFPELNSDEQKSLAAHIIGLYEYDEYENAYRIPEDVWARDCRGHGFFFDFPDNKRYMPFTVTGSEAGNLFDGSQLSRMRKMSKRDKIRYGTALELFNEKLGNVPAIAEENSDDIFFVGHCYEDAIAKAFVKVWNADHPSSSMRIWNDTTMFQCGQKNKDGSLKYPFALADLDRCCEVDGVVGGVEIKSCQFSSPHLKEWKNRICPLSYEIQIRHYMAVCNLPFFYICCAWGIGLDSMCYIYIERDFAIEKKLMEMESAFVNCLETGIEPDVSKQDAKLVYAYRRREWGDLIDTPNDKAVAIPEEKADVVMALASIHEKQDKLTKKGKELEKEKSDLLANEILPLYDRNTYGYATLPDGKRATVKLAGTISKLPNVDEKKAQERFPALYAKYCTKFNGTLFKKEQPAAYAACLADKVVSKDKLFKCTVEVKEYQKGGSDGTGGNTNS